MSTLDNYLIALLIEGQHLMELPYKHKLHFQGYDGQFLIGELVEHIPDIRKIRLIPKTLENYTAFWTKQYRFIGE